MGIPKNERWLHRPKARDELLRALDWAQRNAPRETTVEAEQRKVRRGVRNRGGVTKN